jgi:hypothetical protein
MPMVSVAHFLLVLHNTNSIPTLYMTICHLPTTLLPQNVGLVRYINLSTHVHYTNERCIPFRMNMPTTNSYTPRVYLGLAFVLLVACHQMLDIFCYFK